MKPCKDCVAQGIATNRPAPHPGPRCVSHNRERKKAISAKSHAAHTKKTYGITAEEYWAIYEAQGGKCAMCGRATGKTKRLSVDHDHKCCSGPISCGKCVRGLLCGICNVYLGRVGDDPNVFVRSAQYVRYPPAQAVINSLN